MNAKCIDEMLEALREMRDTLERAPHVDDRTREGGIDGAMSKVGEIARKHGWRPESERLRATADATRAVARQLQEHLDSADAHNLKVARDRDAALGRADEIEARAAELEAQGR